jgi:hypothetical protein
MHVHTYHYAALLQYTHLPTVSLCVDKKHSRIVRAHDLTGHTHILPCLCTYSLELLPGAYYIFGNTRHQISHSYAIVMLDNITAVFLSLHRDIAEINRLRCFVYFAPGRHMRDAFLYLQAGMPMHRSPLDQVFGGQVGLQKMFVGVDNEAHRVGFGAVFVGCDGRRTGPCNVFVGVESADSGECTGRQAIFYRY